MVSTMETFTSSSDSPCAGDLGELDRGRVLAWTRYPPVPAWYYPALGAALGLLACVGPLGERHSALGVAAVVAAAGTVVGILAVYRRMRGQMPSRHMPPEIRRPFLIAVAGILVAFAALAALGATPVWWASPLPGAVLGAVGGPWYERAYRRAADAAERRVGLR